MGSWVRRRAKRLQWAWAGAALLICGGAAAFGQSGGQAAPKPAPSKPELFVQAGMQTGMTGGSLAFSPDGQWYVSGNGQEWQIWSVPLHMELKRWSPVSPNIISKLAVASDSNTILSIGDTVMTRPDFEKGNYESTLTTRIALVDARTGQVQREMTIDGAVTYMAADPAEPVFATLAADYNTVRVLSIADGKTQFTSTLAQKSDPQGGSNEQLGVFFSPDGNLLAAVTLSHMAVWEWKTGKRLLDLDARAFHISDLTRKVAVSYKDQKVSTAEEEHYFYFQGAQFARDGKQMVACSRDELTFFDVDPKKGVAARKPVIPAEDGQVYSACGFAPGGRYFTENFSITGSGMTTSLIDRKSGERKSLDGWVTFYPVPKSDLTFVKALNQSGLLHENGDQVSVTPSTPVLPFHPSFTSANQRLFWRTGQTYPLAWDLITGEFGPVKTNHVAGYALAASADGKRFAYEEPNQGSLSGSIAVAEANAGTVLARFPRGPMFTIATMYEPSLNADGSVLAVLQATGKDEPKGKNDVIDIELAVFHVADQKKLFATAITAKEAENLKTALSPDGTLLAVSLPAGVKVYNVTTGKGVAEFNPPAQNGFFIPVAFSPDGKWLAIACPGWPMLLASTSDWKQQKHLGYVQDAPFAFSPDSRRIAYAQAPGVVPGTVGTPTGGGLAVDDIETGKTLFLAPDADTGIYSWPAFSADGKLVLVNTSEGVNLLNAATGNLLATVYVFGGDPTYDWLVVTPDGLFDGSPDAWQRVNWRFGTTFDVAPLEIYFREFFRPGLLAEIIAGNTPHAPANFAALDRRQPRVEIATDTKTDDAVAQEKVHLTVTVHESRTSQGGQSGGSGVRDLRLFRNGTLVQIWRGDLKLDRSGTARREADVPIVAGANSFTAYAFNHADIKSLDASLALTGADSLQRKGTAYLIAIGVNRYEADKPAEPLNLNYAESDAKGLVAAFTKHQADLDQFAAVKRVMLLSADATRENILAALSILGGASTNSLSEHQRTLFAELAAVRPEDGVFLFYAGHGVAEAGRFYLLPADVQPDRPLDEPGAKTISDLDLSRALEPISPARAFLIVDACNSGQALDSGKTPVGPMNSTGLAQLAYEKGIDILAAAQGMESALESSALAGGHGYLTYALMEGLTTPADAEDGVVTLRPWLEYASRRVPDLQVELATKSVQSNPEGRAPTFLKSAAQTKAGLQHPRMFYRREPEAEPLVVAKFRDQ